MPSLLYFFKEWRRGRRVWLCGGALLCILMVFGIGCGTTPVQDAFNGEFSSVKNNKTIKEYCQSCHLHKDFDSGPHLDKVSQLYNRKVFRYATECRTCHYIELNWLQDEVERKTRMPEDANKGAYRDFEIDTLKAQREQTQELEAEAEDLETEADEEKAEDKAKEEKKKKKKTRKKKKEKKFLGIF